MSQSQRNEIRNLTLAAMLIALGVVLPTLVGPPVASQFLLMHIPALLAGFVIGPKYGLIVGFATPLLRSVTIGGGMPPLMPTATSMAFELATYGFVAGIIYNKVKQSIITVYTALISAMIVGRIVYGIVMFVLLVGFSLVEGRSYGLAAWWYGVVGTSMPGIILQLVLIPLVVVALERSGFMRKR